MKKLMLSKKTKLQTFYGTILFVALAGIILFVPPTHSIIVAMAITILSILTYILALFLFEKRFALLSAMFTASFLAMNYIAGFNLINIILLVSFIIGVAILIRR